MANALKDRVSRRGTKTPPELGRAYALSHRCEVCRKSIVPGQTWKFTPTGGKVHYCCGDQNPGHNPITDRACRYRANAHPPSGPKICAFCGTKQQIQVGHIDGHEENGEPENLIWTCRSCNMLHANTLRASGLGRLTVQYNPATKGAQNLAQWFTAVMATKGGSDAMTVRAAVAMIRATPVDDRSGFAYEIWQRRRLRARASSQNPASIPAKRSSFTVSEAARAARAAGARIGDTAAFENWLKKTGLQGRGPKVQVILKREFWKGVETGEGSEPQKSAESLRYKGQTIRKGQLEGWYQVSNDPESRFDTLKDAKRFVDAQSKNPRRRIA